MATTAGKLTGLAAGVLLLAAGGWWGVRVLSSGRGASTQAPFRTAAAPPAPEPPPVLRGARGEAPQLRTTQTVAAGEASDRGGEASARTPVPTAGGLEALIADIRSHASVEFWADPPKEAAMEGRSGVVIVRAPAFALDAVGRYLEERRRLARAAARAAVDDAPEEPAPVEPDAAQREEAWRDLQHLAREILERDVELGEAVDLVEEGKLQEADRLLEALLADEPDHTLAEALEREILTGAEARTRMDAVRATAFWRQALRLTGWLGRWPSEATQARLRSLLERLPAARLLVAGKALAELLERGPVSVHARGKTLYEVLRTIQIDTGADVGIAARGHWALGRTVLDEIHLVDVPLREALDRVLEALPAPVREELVWHIDRWQAVLVRRGEKPDLLHMRLFDVRDLLGGEVESPGPPPGGSERPPPPPTYTAPPESPGR